MTLQKVRTGGLEFWMPEGHPGVAFTNRIGGCSSGPFCSLNVGEHTEDSMRSVVQNRRAVSEALGISEFWVTARQVHGAQALLASHAAENNMPAREADAIVAGPGEPPVSVVTADCLPIILKGGSSCAVIHAGWRGLAAGVIDQTLDIVRRGARHVEAFIGPSIGPCHFEVGPEVGQAFRSRYPGAPDCEIRVHGSRHFDLRAAARWVLRRSEAVVDDWEPPCTFCDESYFSFRRDGVTGRQAAIAWV